MDRCALFVDAGYLLADGAMAVHGTRHRDAVSWDYPGILQLLGNLARERTGLPLLRCYWYEASVDGRRAPEHEAVADLPGLKLRLGRVRPGRREGVDTEIHRDVMMLARNTGIADAVLVSGEEDLAHVVADVQDLGVRVTIVHVAVDGNWTISRTLRQECDDLIEIGAGHLRPYVRLLSGGLDSPGLAGATRGPATGPLSNGQGVAGHGRSGPGAHQPAGSGAHAGPPAIYTGPPSLPQPALPAGRSAQYAEAGGYDRGSYEQSGYESASSGYQPGSYDKPAYETSGYDQPAKVPYPTGPQKIQYDKAAYETAKFGHQPAASMHAAPTPSAPSVPAPASPATSGSPGSSVAAASSPAGGTPVMPQQAPAHLPQRRSAQPGHGGAHGAGASHGASHGASQGATQTHGAAPTHGGGYAASAAPGAHASSASPGAHASSAGQGAHVGSIYPATQHGPYTNPQPAQIAAPATTLADAVKSAHQEGHDFGESVARDAPALWLEAVLARKPRMPSDLEARLLQGSSLPIDFLLHDEVRHALRRGFWDALERSRR